MCSLHDLPPHLSYVSTLPDITQKLNYDTDELKQRLTDTRNHIPQRIINGASSKQGDTLNTYCDLTTQRDLFRAT